MSSLSWRVHNTGTFSEKPQYELKNVHWKLCGEIIRISQDEQQFSTRIVETVEH